MSLPLHQVLSSYNDKAPLENASTIPAAWYTDERVADLERQNVFGGTWQVVARADQLRNPASSSQLN